MKIKRCAKSFVAVLVALTLFLSFPVYAANIPMVAFNPSTVTGFDRLFMDKGSYYEFDDRDGRQVKGVSLYVSYEDEQITGYATEKISVKNIPSNIDDLLGAEIDVDFNKQGRVVQVDWGKPATVSASGAK